MKRQQLRLLLIEDDPDDAHLIMGDLDESAVYAFSTEWVTNLDKGLDALDAKRFDLVLTDLFLPGSPGLETLFTLHRHHPEIPIVVLSGIEDAVTALLAMKNGAQDFLVKDSADRRRIHRAIGYAIERHHLEQRVRNHAEERAAFTYAVSHDLRTPLVSIDFLLDETLTLLEDVPVPDPVRHHLETISARIGTMEDLIEDLLALARVEEPAPDQTVVLDEIVEDVLLGLADKVEARGIEVQVDLAALPPVRGNRAQLRQLMANLIGNAVKYTRDNGGRVRVAARAISDDNGVATYRVAVEDNGPGIPRAQRQKAFQVFERLPDPLGRQIPGTGIGLGIAKRVAHHHDTWIHLRDAPEGGALFYFDLPRARVRSEEHGAAVSDDAASWSTGTA